MEQLAWLRLPLLARRLRNCELLLETVSKHCLGITQRHIETHEGSRLVLISYQSCIFSFFLPKNMNISFHFYDDMVKAKVAYDWLPAVNYFPAVWQSVAFKLNKSGLQPHATAVKLGTVFMRLAAILVQFGCD